MRAERPSPPSYNEKNAMFQTVKTVTLTSYCVALPLLFEVINLQVLREWSVIISSVIKFVIIYF